MSSFKVNFFDYFLKIHYQIEPLLVKEISFSTLEEEAGEPPVWAEVFAQILEKCIVDPDFVPELDWLDFSHFSHMEKKIYETLAEVGPGQTISYGQLALKAGFSQEHARMVGNLMAKNPFPIIIPCHRVIKQDGTPGEYRGGRELKAFLLQLESGGISHKP